MKQVFFVSKKVREEMGESLFQGGGGRPLKRDKTSLLPVGVIWSFKLHLTAHI